MTIDTNSLLWMLGGGVAVVAVLVVTYAVLRSRRVPGEHVFVASRWSRGNHLLPTQVAIDPTSVVQYIPHWFGKREHSINMAHVASVDIETTLFFSNVMIENSGGTDPVRCHGHRKRDALEMKRLINQYQSQFYQGKPQ